MTVQHALPAEVETGLRAAIIHVLATHVGQGPVTVESVASSLYAGWYTGWSEVPRSGDIGTGRQFVESLRAAHADSARFEDGWTVLHLWPTGRIVAARAHDRRVLDPIDYVSPDRPGLPPRPGSTVQAVARRDSVTAQPGYWMTFGSRWVHADGGAGRLRLYWNAGAASAPALVREITSRLGATGAPYALKLPSDAQAYGRTDAAVLFLPRGAFDAAVPELRRVHAALAPSLAADTPPLTRRLERGLGLAEDPPPGESYGSLRCRLVAEGLVPELARDGVGHDALLDAVCRRLREAGISLDRPYLNPPGDRDYAW
jgi:hypothetical protein